MNLFIYYENHFAKNKRLLIDNLIIAITNTNKKQYKNFIDLNNFGENQIRNYLLVF